jgi:hypothetical protein
VTSKNLTCYFHSLSPSSLRMQGTRLSTIERRQVWIPAFAGMTAKFYWSKIELTMKSNPPKNYIGILDGSGKVWGVRIPDIDGCVGGDASPECGDQCRPKGPHPSCLACATACHPLRRRGVVSSRLVITGDASDASLFNPQHPSPNPAFAMSQDHWHDQVFFVGEMAVEEGFQFGEMGLECAGLVAG